MTESNKQQYIQALQNIKVDLMQFENSQILERKKKGAILNLTKNGKKGDN